MLKQQHQLFVALLTAVDAVVATGACLLALWVRVSAESAAWPVGLVEVVRESMLLPAVPLLIACLAASGLYRPRRDRSVFDEQVRILRASIVAVIGLLTIAWIVGSDLLVSRGAGGLSPERAQVLTLALAMTTMTGAWRLGFRLVLQQLRRRGYNLRHVAIVGTGRLGQIAAQTLGRNSWTGLNVAYFVSHHDRTNRRRCLDKPVMGGLEGLESTLETNPPDAVYLALPSSKASDMPALLRRLERFAVDVRIVPDVTPRHTPHAMSVNELDGMPILSYRECPLQGFGGVVKRGIDLVGAAVGLVVLAPLLLAIAVAVRLTSGGPAIFRQRRVSLAGEEFWIYKFRTMRDASASDTPGWTQRDDPRITRFGRWLRQTSLDELPQLINVLFGDMSLVGPRPERPELIQQFREDWRGYMLRQHVKAGMTGWAQVNGHRGDSSLRKRLQYDLFYIRNWSVVFDLRILALTVVRGFVHPNAH